MTLVRRAVGRVFVHYRYFLVLDIDPPDGFFRAANMRKPELAGATTDALVVLTSIHTGFVRLEIETHSTEPDQPSGWEESIEVAFEATAGDARVCSWDQARIEGLPPVSFRGAGNYTIRVLANGRSQHPVPATETAEQYLLQVW